MKKLVGGCRALGAEGLQRSTLSRTDKSDARLHILGIPKCKELYFGLNGGLEMKVTVAQQLLRRVAVARTGASLSSQLVLANVDRRRHIQ